MTSVRTEQMSYLSSTENETEIKASTYASLVFQTKPFPLFAEAQNLNISGARIHVKQHKTVKEYNEKKKNTKLCISENIPKKLCQDLRRKQKS